MILNMNQESHLETSCIHISIHYSKNIGGGFSHSCKLEHSTDLASELSSTCIHLFESFYEEEKPIRKVSISLGKLSQKKGQQLNLFEPLKKKEQEEKNQEEIITSAACVYIELSENKKFKEECLKNSCTINTNTLIEKGLLDEKNVSKNQVIHIYLDQKVKKCIIK